MCNYFKKNTYSFIPSSALISLTQPGGNGGCGLRPLEYIAPAAAAAVVAPDIEALVSDSVLVVVPSHVWETAIWPTICWSVLGLESPNQRKILPLQRKMTKTTP